MCPRHRQVLESDDFIGGRVSPGVLAEGGEDENFFWAISVLPCKEASACYIDELVELRSIPASVAQLAEPRFCKPEVVGSSPTASSPDVIESLHSNTPPSVGVARMRKTGETQFDHLRIGGIPEWPKGPDCKSGGKAFAGSNPASPIF